MTGPRGARLAGALGAGLAVVVAPALVTPSAAAEVTDGAAWAHRVARAAHYAQARRGRVGFALVTPSGRLLCRQCRRTEPGQSVVKAMLMLAYLRRVRGRALRARDRSLLTPMIRWSDNVAAREVFEIVGRHGLRAVARIAAMHRFVPAAPWYMSRITAADQAAYFFRIDRLVPARHRRYAMGLLTGITAGQRWGIPPTVPRGWSIAFKGGWGDGSGDVVHQVALLRRGGRRIALAILTRFNPDQRYGAVTVHGIAARLLAGV